MTFAGGEIGPWQVERLDAVIGPSLPAANRLQVLEGNDIEPSPGSAWNLRGFTSNVRYVTRAEQVKLEAKQEGLGRDGSKMAALIPIRKSEQWWALPVDDRRRVLEESSNHIAIGLEYLPGIARRLHHGRDLGEPFDFLTWFEYAPHDADAFETLVQRLRATEEWSYVENEIDIRLTRDSAR